MARVTVRVNVRDLTQGELARIDDRFNRLARSVNRFAGRRTQQNMTGMRDSLRDLDRAMGALRGRIPNDEFNRLTIQARRLDQTLRAARGLPMSSRQLAIFRQGLRDLDRDLRRVTSGDGGNVRVRLNPPNQGDHNRFRRALMAPFRQTGRILGGLMSDGIGQGIVAGFQSAGPIGIAVFAGLLASAVTLLGAALGGILVFAFGGAVAGIAGFMAAKSEEVKKVWKTTTESIKKDFAGAGKPMEEVLIKGMGLLEDMSAKFAPSFKRAVEEAAPHLLIFQQKLAHGIEAFGKIAFEPMMEAFNELLDSLGPEMETFFTHLGEAFAFLAEAVTENSDEVALAIRYVLEIVTALVYVLGALVVAWGWVVRNLEFASAAFEVTWGWVNRNWDTTVTMTQTGIDSIGVLTAQLWGWVNRNWRRAVAFTAPGLSGAIGLVRALWGWVNRNWRRAVAFSAPGLASAINSVRTLWGWVNRNWSRVVSLSVSMPGLSAAKAGLAALGFARGGVVGKGIGKAATGGVRNNMTLVGEAGPELVDLPVGSRVRSNPDTQRILGGRQGGGTTLVLKSSGRRADDLLLELLREAIHQRGGDPVTVLGG